MNVCSAMCSMLRAQQRLESGGWTGTCQYGSAMIKGSRPLWVGDWDGWMERGGGKSCEVLLNVLSLYSPFKWKSFILFHNLFPPYGSSDKYFKVLFEGYNRRKIKIVNIETYKAIFSIVMCIKNESTPFEPNTYFCFIVLIGVPTYFNFTPTLFFHFKNNISR